VEEKGTCPALFAGLLLQRASRGSIGADTPRLNRRGRSAVVGQVPGRMLHTTPE
jgi:hypothetical protein